MYKLKKIDKHFYNIVPEMFLLWLLMTWHAYVFVLFKFSADLFADEL